LRGRFAEEAKEGKGKEENKKKKGKGNKRGGKETISPNKFLVTALHVIYPVHQRLELPCGLLNSRSVKTLS